MSTVRASLAPADRFVTRHIGPSPDETRAMLETLGYESLDAFIDAVVPADIRLRRPLALPPGRTEREVLQALRGLAAQNQLFRSYIGMGYAGCFTPQVIQRNVLENPGWYTAYTPYQAEIAQGRLEALLNFQAVVIDLTGVPKIESETADGLIRSIEAVQLLGAKVILAGISAIIADTFVGIGARFSRIKTTADLQSALEEAKNLLSAESSLT